MPNIEATSRLHAEATSAHIEALSKADVINLRLGEARAELRLKEAAKAGIIAALAEGVGTAAEDKPGMQLSIKSANANVVDATGRVDLLASVHAQALANAKVAEADKHRAANVHVRETSKVKRVAYADDLEAVAKLCADLDKAFSKALASGADLIDARYHVDALTPSGRIAAMPADDTPTRLDKLCAALPRRVLLAVVESRVTDHVSHAELARWHRGEAK